MSNVLAGKTILVTGASSGLGKAIAIYFSTVGARVVLSGRNEERLLETLKDMSGSNHLYFIADLAKVESVQVMMDAVFANVGALDSVIHCAGIQKTLPLQALKEHQFDDIFNTNVKSAQFIAKFLRKKGRHNSQGTSLVLLSSVAAVCGEPAISSYSASKAALLGLSKSLAVELARQNIRVNCIAPGHVETEMAIEFSKQLTVEQRESILLKHPLGLGKPEYIAQAAEFLASDKSSWITGTTIFVDGGYSAH
ncbi:SDR family NAD(P)-dependent oxidoreductase [Shewanella sp. MBTL60-007]|uniref:SDR family NAD(P)-dependent oxidoreductase n=1 Tax=Shewanella sp. MBTL60-007 TaxID=2815911 RepID=UPI001BC38D98|nr:glucose 1-dehydrogenase [Shewanella sp. MBTL60-007]GIU32421.1 oxidoreductase [Shewanella sp. MBTL60-007]